MQPLEILLLLPVIGAVITLLIPADRDKHIKAVSLIFSFAALLWSAYLALGFNWLGAFQLTSTYELFTLGAKGVPVSFSLGVDGLGMLMVLLTALLFVVSTIVSFNITTRVREYFAMFLLLEAGVLGVFMATDLFCFYVFWELILIPMFLIIGIWGGANRQYASVKFILFTLAGSLFMLLGFIGYYLESGSFSLVDPAQISRDSQLVLFWFVFIGLAVKIPLFPFHTWLPDAHTEAPTAGSIILAGVLLKMGSYGFLRVLFPLFPYATEMFATFLAALGVVNIVYGAFLALALKDIKRIIAASSISHMGFVVLALATLSEMGFAAGTLQMINHGIITGALFLLVGVIYDRTHKRGLDDFGGLYKVVPMYYGIMLLVTLAAIGLPGLNGFVSEFTCLLSGFIGFNARPEFHWLAAIGASGVVLGAVYMLRLVQKVFSGPVQDRWRGIPDIDARETIAVLPLCFLIVFLGVAPGTIYDLMNGTMRTLEAIFR